MTLAAAFFYLFSAILVASAVLVIAARNPVHSVLFLILAFVNAAGLFILLGAEFLAMILIIVYVGAVAVLFLFVVMMLDVLHMDYNGVRATLGKPIPAILLLAFITAGVVHMEIGMRSIVIDYVSGRAREWALVANTCFCALLGLACAYATLRLSFT